ncbi:MAG: FKBP-type peptidyl-prolyl cis-trans isomerase [Candidatus Saccharimonadaceae bacterium]|nr:FKBP-type peptidyl-prolyl cis-trans isomerase [Candidatus Saccharimonadaceae bacterium]
MNEKLEGKKLFAYDPIGLIVDLKIIDLVQGNGEVAQQDSTITAHYTGALANSGVIFQSSHDVGQPAIFGLNQVISGWTKGVPGIRVGGKRRLLIPSGMAYGSRSIGNIPPNSDLVFDIELVAVK